jgi:hypothetical protein
MGPALPISILLLRRKIIIIKSLKPCHFRHTILIREMTKDSEETLARIEASLTAADWEKLDFNVRRARRKKYISQCTLAFDYR